MKRVLIGLLVIGLFLAGCAPVSAPYEADVYTNPRVVEGEYMVRFSDIQPLSIEELRKANLNQGFPADTPAMLVVWISQIKEWGNQQDVEVLSITPLPDQQTEDAEFGNTLLYWDLSDEVEKGEVNISVKFRYRAHQTSYEIDPEKIGEYDKDSEIYKLYTREENWIEFTPEVKALVAEIVGNEKNPYQQALIIYDWILDNMEYWYPPMAERGVKYSLPRRSGDCGEYSFIFIACCRYLGIPSRLVQGGMTDTPGDHGGHGWAEVYLPNYGWVPVDPQCGQSVEETMESWGWPYDRHHYFGHLDNKRVIFSKGMNIKLEPPIPEIFPQNGGIFSGKDGELAEQPVTDGRVPIPRCYPVGWGFKEVKIDTVLKIGKG